MIPALVTLFSLVAVGSALVIEVHSAGNTDCTRLTHRHSSISAQTRLLPSTYLSVLEPAA